MDRQFRPGKRCLQRWSWAGVASSANAVRDQLFLRASWSPWPLNGPLARLARNALALFVNETKVLRVRRPPEFGDGANERVVERTRDMAG
jgi:hypothetical protein